MAVVSLVDAAGVDGTCAYADEFGPEGLSLDIVTAGTAVSEVVASRAEKATDGW
jgi:hypothetical protein